MGMEAVVHLGTSAMHHRDEGAGQRKTARAWPARSAENETIRMLGEETGHVHTQSIRDIARVPLGRGIEPDRPIPTIAAAVTHTALPYGEPGW
jgi:hypothetical protein